MRHAIQGGGKIPINDSGSVPVYVGNQQINPVENVLYYEDLTADLDQAANTELFVIPDTMMYTFMAISMVNSGGTTGDISMRWDMSQDQSGIYHGDQAFRNCSNDASLATIGHNVVGYCGHLAGSAIRINVKTQGTGETGAVRIWLRGQSSFGA